MSSNTAGRYWKLSLLFLLSGLVALPFADLDIIITQSSSEWARIGQGLLHPIWNWHQLGPALIQTIGFAVQGLVLGLAIGAILGVCYRHFWVKVLAASLRSVHEIFYALLFIQIFGITSLTAVLAIGISYSGAFAKVFGEFLQEVLPHARDALPSGTSRLSALFFTELPQIWTQLGSYIRYRFECAVRSSVVLGFVGLPTIGFYLDSVLKGVGVMSETNQNIFDNSK